MTAMGIEQGAASIVASSPPNANPFEAKDRLNNIYKFNSHLIENTTRLDYKDQLFNAV
jgi:hypothetical protein